MQLWLDKYPEDLNAPCSAPFNLAPLAVATLFNSHFIAEYLLKRGAEVDIINRGSILSPLHLALRDEDMVAAQLLLLHGANIFKFDGDGFNALYYVMSKGNLDGLYLCRTLGGDFDLNTKALSSKPDRMLALHVAAQNNHSHLVQALLALGADPTVPNAAGQTPLDIARMHKKEQAEAVLLAHLARK